MSKEPSDIYYLKKNKKKKKRLQKWSIESYQDLQNKQRKTAAIQSQMVIKKLSKEQKKKVA